MTTLALINDTKDIKDILKEALKFVQKSTLIALFVHEEKLFSIDEIFKLEDNSLDKEAVEKEIKSALEDLKYEGKVAVFVKIDDSKDRVEDILKDIEALVVTKLNDATIELSDTKYKIFYTKADRVYKKIAINIDLNQDSKKCIDFAKEYFKNAAFTLVYDYINYIDLSYVGADPMLAPAVDPTINVEILEAKKREFEEFKKEVGLDGVFLEDFANDDELIEYINGNNFDLMITCNRDLELEKFSSSIILM